MALDVTALDGTPVKVPAGGVAHLAAAAKSLRAGHPHSVTVSAGDLIGASPLVSALFLDEPTIEAMEEVGVEYNAVGNHEFDKGSAELLRMQEGGCAKHTPRQPCKVEPFDGADFRFLAANVLTADGRTLFRGTAIKDFGPVQVGFIGMTLKETATLVPPSGVAGLTFGDEAATANAAVPALTAAGADAIVLLIHQGGRTTGVPNDKSCPGLSGDILPIIEKLDAAIDVIISGHTHAAYLCELPKDGRSDPVLLTSAGRYGTLISDIRLTFGPDGRLQSTRADNVVVQGQGYSTAAAQVPLVTTFPVFPADAPTQAIVDRYVAAAAPEAARVVGTLSGPAPFSDFDDESPAANLVADAQLAAGRPHGAQVAFINGGGVRSGLVPDAQGHVRYGQIFQMQPFGNSILVVELTGAQLKALLEQQFGRDSYAADARPALLIPSANFSFAYDLSRPKSQRIARMRLDGAEINPSATYRVAVNNFLASGGDGYSILTQRRVTGEAGNDLDALESWLAKGQRVPPTGRTRNLTAS